LIKTQLLQGISIAKLGVIVAKNFVGGTLQYGAGEETKKEENLIY
jgi:hypothetical protein